MKIFIMWFAIILGAFGLFAHLLHGELVWGNALIGAFWAAVIFTVAQRTWIQVSERLKTLH